MKINKKSFYILLYKVIYIAIINNLISENKYIDILQRMNMNGFKTYHINSFDKLSVQMCEYGLNNSFNISILLYLRDRSYKYLSEIAHKNPDIGTILFAKNKNIIDRIGLIIKLIRRKIKILKAFKKIDKYDTINLYLNIENPSSIKNQWKNIMRKDILDRLYLLGYKHYSITQLHYMDVDIQLVSALNEYPYEKLEIYYLDTINKIDKSLRGWLMECEKYIDVENNYVKTCQCIMSSGNNVL